MLIDQLRDQLKAVEPELDAIKKFYAKGSKKRAKPIQAKYKISSDFSKICDVDEKEITRGQAIKSLWSYIKDNELKEIEDYEDDEGKKKKKTHINMNKGLKKLFPELEEINSKLIMKHIGKHLTKIPKVKVK